MAQNKKPKQGKRTPAYSADGMAVSLIVGLILIALGVLLFLSVTLGLNQTIFKLLKDLCGCRVLETRSTTNIFDADFIEHLARLITELVIYQYRSVGKRRIGILLQDIQCVKRSKEFAVGELRTITNPNNRVSLAINL